MRNETGGFPNPLLVYYDAAEYYPNLPLLMSLFWFIIYPLIVTIFVMGSKEKLELATKWLHDMTVIGKELVNMTIVDLFRGIASGIKELWNAFTVNRILQFVGMMILLSYFLEQYQLSLK